MNDDVVTVAGACLATYWVLGYLASAFMRWPVRAGEREFISWWLRGDLNHAAELRHLHQTGRDGNTALYTTGQLYLARRYQNGDNPFILLNFDRYGYMGGLIGRRLRRLIDAAAARETIPVLPVAFTPWNRAISPGGGTFTLVHRRGRECVFSRTTKSCQTDYFLSGFDSNESPPLYFLTQLPGPVTSVKQAREALKPPSVVLAEQDGRKVYRQGDMFAVPTELTTPQIVDLDGSFGPEVALYGTAHYATLVASLPDGTQFAQGWMTHTPSDRPPDHGPLRLATRKWHLIAKNTTPMRIKEVKK